MEHQDVYGYKFSTEDAATKAELEILAKIGRVVVREGQSLTISAPTESATAAAQIAERHGGKMTLGSV